MQLRRAWWQSIGLPATVAGAALTIVALFLYLLGADPVEAGQVVLDNVFGSADGIAYALFYATPLIFTGLAVAVGFRAGLFNIGAEGQLYMAAIAAAWVGLHVGAWPAWLGLAACALAGAGAGAAWGALPGFMRAYRGAHEVITTIMLNFIAIGLTTYWATYTLREPGQAIPRTAPLPDHLHLSRAADWAPAGAEWVGSHVPLNTMFLVAVAACFILQWAWRRTVWGFELQVVGADPAAAEAVGIPVRRRLVLAMLISGALAGGAGLNEVLGHQHRFLYAFSNGLGFLGIAVALLGRNQPLGVLAAALGFGVLVRGGLFLDLFTERVNKDVVFVLQGVLIWCVGFGGAVRGAVAARWGGAGADA